MVRSIFSQRYNYRQILENEALDEIFRSLPNLPKINKPSPLKEGYCYIATRKRTADEKKKEIFRSLPNLPKINKPSPLKQRSYYTATRKLMDDERKKVKKNKIKDKNLLTPTDGYDSDLIPITTRLQLEKKFKTPLVERYEKKGDFQ